MDQNVKQKLALVYCTIPSFQEIEQFKLLTSHYDVSFISTESVCGYLTQITTFDKLECVMLADYDHNPTYMPGLENTLKGFDVVVVKERMGFYAYQAIKAKLKYKFRLVVLVDNLMPLFAEDVEEIRTIRTEITNAADAFIVNSKAAQRALLIEGIKPDKVYYFPAFVQTFATRTKKSKAQALENLELSEGSFVISHIGQIEWEESLADLMYGVKLAIDENTDLRRRLKIVFCGIGSYAESLAEIITTLGLNEYVKFIIPIRENLLNLLEASDCIFYGAIPARDRIDGDPYRVLIAMANNIPIIANRTPLVEEYCDKHRIDFCFGSPHSIARAIIKSYKFKAIVNNIKQKNISVVEKQYSLDIVQKAMRNVFMNIMSIAPSLDLVSIENQIIEAESLIQDAHYIEAVNLIETLLSLKALPSMYRSYLYKLVGDAFTKLEDIEMAKDAYNKAIDLDPQLHKAYIGLGSLALLKQQFEVAILNFQKAISLDNTDEMANLGLGLAFQGIGNLDEATNWVANTLKINPQNTAALYTLTKLSYDRNNFDQLQQCLNNYLSINPDDINVLFSLAGVYYKLDNYDEALNTIDKILKINPDYTPAKDLQTNIRHRLQQRTVNLS